MSDYDLPELPSDEELGITDEDREAYADDLGESSPEMSDAEMRALLGDTPAAKPEGSPADAKAAKKAEKERRKAEKKRLKEEKRRRKEAKKKGEPERPETEAERAERVARSLAAAAHAPPPPKAEAAPAATKTKTKTKTPGAKDPEGPRSRWRGPVTLAAMIVVSVIASTRTGLPGPVAANASDSVFSSSRAMSTLIEIATAAHPTGSPEHARIRDLLVDRLRSLGLEPEVQTTTSGIRAGNTETMATVRNILARIEGSDPTGAVLMTAHYDGRGQSIAAADDGSGVVTILEAVRALLAGEQPRNDVIVLLTDAEELELLGARAFVDEHPWMEDVRLVLSFEMRGAAGPSIMFETNDQNGWVVRAFEESDPAPFANSMAFEVYRRMPNDTDFTPFKEAGRQGLNFAAIDNAHVYHQAYDTPESLSESTLQHHGLHALAAVRHFGQADLSSVDAPNVVYFTLPLAGMVVYGQGLVLPLSGVLLLLLVGGVLLARRAGVGPGRVGIGVLVALAGTAVTFGAAYALSGWLVGFHPEAGSLQGSSYHREGWYMLALVGVALAAVTGVHALARRWLGALELALGALVLPVVAAIAVGFVAPLAAMNLQWPVMAALLSVALLALLGARADGPVGVTASALLVVPVIVLMVPLTELVWIALTFDLAPVLAVLIATALYLCLPALEGLRHPNAWWAPVTGLVVAAASVGLGVLTSRPSEIRPSPSTLVYAYEHGTGAAVWATDPRADSLDAEATAWAVARAGGSFESTRDLSRFAWLSGQVPTVSAPVVSALPPEVVVARDSVEGGLRHVTLHVRSRIGAELLAFTYGDVGSTRLLSVNGREIAQPGSLEWVFHWGQPDGAVVLELEVPEDEAIGLHIVEHLLRPWELLGDEAFARPPDLAPDVSRASDRAMFRYSVGAFADPRHAILMPNQTPGAVAPGGAQPTAQPDTASAAGAAAQPPDTSAVIDTLAVPSDSGGAPVDTLGAPRDTLPGPTDTLGAPTDTLTAPPDTPAAPTDTLRAPTDTLAAPPDTTTGRSDALTAHSGANGAPTPSGSPRRAGGAL